MENYTLKQYVLYGAVPLALVLLYLKPGLFIKARYTWLAWRNTPTTHGHGHGHSHSQPESDGGKKKNVLKPLKDVLFEGLSSQMISKVKGLSGLNTGIRILEIGVGAGTNFMYFPKKCSFIAVDPNPYFESNVKESLAQHPGIELERRFVCGAEDMDDVPDSSVDAVVATAVFCSVNDVQKVFRQIIRVLVPGGKFYFLDHIRNDENSKRRYFTDFLEYSGLAKLIFNATQNRNIGNDIRSADFSDVKNTVSDLNNHRFVFGVATK